MRDGPVSAAEERDRQDAKTPREMKGYRLCTTRQPILKCGSPRFTSGPRYSPTRPRTSTTISLGALAAWRLSFSVGYPSAGMAAADPEELGPRLTPSNSA